MNLETLKQETHFEFNELMDYKLFYINLLKKNWDDLESNKIVREIIANLDVCIVNHRRNCPICSPLRWGSQNSFKEDLCT